jgi:ribose 5-phosphate isomerase RpiB
MSDFPTILPRPPKLIGAADHGGYELERYLVRMLREAGYEVTDRGGRQPTKVDDDYPDSFMPLARPVACGKIDLASAIFGSGKGASVNLNERAGVRNCLI